MTKKYRGLRMPNLGLSEQDADDVIAYLDAQSFVITNEAKGRSALPDHSAKNYCARDSHYPTEVGVALGVFMVLVLRIKREAGRSMLGRNAERRPRTATPPVGDSGTPSSSMISSLYERRENISRHDFVVCP